jgi:very-short-patch-repair endonuclease
MTRVGRRWIAYDKGLRPRAQTLRRDPTVAERKLWYEFLRELPEKFTRQKPLGKYVADFYCSRHRLVIEVDGDSHYTNKAQTYDAARTSVLESEGIRVLRFTNPDVMQNFEAVCAAILQALRETAAAKSP